MESVKERQSALKLEYLEITAQLAEMKRAYLVDGVSGDIRVRARLEAARTKAELELHNINVVLSREKEKAKEFRRISLVNILVTKLEAAGMGSFVEAAKEESMAALRAAGLEEAYKS